MTEHPRLVLLPNSPSDSVILHSWEELRGSGVMAVSVILEDGPPHEYMKSGEDTSSAPNPITIAFKVTPLGRNLFSM